jgi:hypothetical protein
MDYDKPISTWEVDDYDWKSLLTKSVVKNWHTSSDLLGVC